MMCELKQPKYELSTYIYNFKNKTQLEIDFILFDTPIFFLITFTLKATEHLKK